MGNGANFIVTATAAVISRHNRKKTIRKINKMNENNRRITNIGRVDTDAVVSAQELLGNVCISGGTEEVRNRVILQNCKHGLANGIPTIILHEGNYHLEYDVKREFMGKCYCRTISKSEPFYDPLLRLNDQEISNVLIDTSKESNPIGADGSLYIKSISCLARKKGITPYTRMIAAFPYAQAQMVISNLEKNGGLTPVEASAIRNDIKAGEGERAKIESFFSNLIGESDIVAGKGELGRSTSILECIRNRGILIMDVETCAKKNQMSFVRAELEKCINEGLPVRLVIDAMTLANSTLLLKLLGNMHSTFWWTLSTPDINALVNAGKNLTSWVALTHKTIMFANSLSTSEALSKELGDFDYIEVTSSHSGGTDYGNFGLHFGVNDNVQTSMRREKVVKPEDISSLAENEFFVLNNNTSEIMKGVFI